MLYKQIMIIVYFCDILLFIVGGTGNLPLVTGVVVSVTIILATILAIIVIAYIIVRHQCKFTLLANVCIVTIHTVILLIDRCSHKE